MNHGLKINNNVLEITLPEEVHIDKVIVNRKMFSQRQRVCESCKYHDLEGHEEPCVSCEVGNSNYVPSVEQEERMEERTETHACDCISRQAAIEALERDEEYNADIPNRADGVRDAIITISSLPSAQPEQKWIPCSEQLPDIKEHHVSEPCIVYCENGAYGFAELEENIFGQVGWNCEREDDYHEPLGNVIAWMPLPEPYKEEDE